MEKFDLIAFDIDGTLTRSKLPLDVEMATLLCRLMKRYKVAIISGANHEQFKWQIIDCLSCLPEHMKNLYLLPVDGTVFCSYDDDWQCENDAPISREEKALITTAFEDIFVKSGLSNPDKIYGELIEDRGAQLNFSALGQNAPIELKEKWDTDNKKRARIVEILKSILPSFSMRIGGTTSIEVTRTGIDKAYGLRKLMERTGISKERILYIGDKLFEGGNDAPVLTLGIECRVVNDPEETKKTIFELLK
ncbi:MAG: HAD-IIB family hydrolase [bacterium]|nr:HAD-IIB family hydrolase [bacterium]